MTEWLGRFLGLWILGLLWMPVSVPAMEMSLQSDTLFRFLQRDTKTETDAAVIPVYEYLKVDIDNPEELGMAFHMYGWGRSDFADNNYYSDATTGELLYGYLEYRNEQAHFNAKLGRQHLFEGVTNEAVDGLRLSSDLGQFFTGSIYAGQPVGLDDTQGRSGDILYGVHLIHHMIGQYDLGLSYKRIKNDSREVEEMAGLDLSAYLPFGIDLYGFSAYNLANDGWAEHSYDLNFTIGPVSMRPYYQKFQYDDYFGTTAKVVNPFSFLANTDEKLQVVGTDLTLPVGESWTMTAKAKHYDYDVLDETSQYYAYQSTWSGEGANQIGTEFGFMNGDTARNSYYLVRLFTYWDQIADFWPISFISTDLVYVVYDTAIYNEDQSLFLSLGVGKKFVDEKLELKLSADYSQDPYFDNDLRGMLTASYHFGREL